MEFSFNAFHQFWKWLESWSAWWWSDCVLLVCVLMICIVMINVLIACVSCLEFHFIPCLYLYFANDLCWTQLIWGSGHCVPLRWYFIIFLCVPISWCLFRKTWRFHSVCFRDFVFFIRNLPVFDKGRLRPGNCRTLPEKNCMIYLNYLQSSHWLLRRICDPIAWHFLNWYI